MPQEELDTLQEKLFGLFKSGEPFLAWMGHFTPVHVGSIESVQMTWRFSGAYK